MHAGSAYSHFLSCCPFTNSFPTIVFLQEQTGNPLGSRIQRVEESPINTEVLGAWRNITSNPNFKDVDVNELCVEFAKLARCDGTKVVLEPEGIRHITEKFLPKTFEPSVLSGLAGRPVDDKSAQQQLPSFPSTPSDTAEIPSIEMTSPASMNETDGVSSCDVLDFGSFGFPSSLNQTGALSSGQTRVTP
ncbi:hypothetical protein EDD15DRAFT_1300862 [Pisolithus albus]|nr:hypothetical protein EDD15DRAFT_1300862 [Pisolithus albus]